MPPNMPIPEPVKNVDDAIRKSTSLFETISKMDLLEADIFFSYIWDNLGVVDSGDGQIERITNYRFRSEDFRNAFELSLAILVKLQAMPPEPTIHILSLESLVVKEMARFWGEVRPRKPINTSRNHGSFYAFCMVLSEDLQLDLNPDKVRSGISKYLNSLKKSPQKSYPTNAQYARLLPSAEEVIRRSAYPNAHESPHFHSSVT